MNEDLSQIVADLQAQVKKGEDLSPGISRVRSAIKSVIEGNTIFGRFQALVESFREVIPEKKQRYQVAITALSTTSKLSRQEIANAINDQLDELKILEKLLMPALPRPDELKATEARSHERRNEISRLREKIAQLEKEEINITNSMAGQENETAVIEKALREVFTDMRAEIASVKKEVEQQSVESAVQPPIPVADIKTDIAMEKPSSGQISITGQLPPHNDTKPQKADADAIFPESTPISEPKKCRMCGGRMDYYLTEKKWQCFSCAHEEPEKNEVQNKNRELSADEIFPRSTPVSELKQDGEKVARRTTPEPATGSELTQKCTMCGGRMDYYIADRKWQCYSCGFEYITNEVQGRTEEKEKSEEKREHSNALLAMPPSESLFDRSSTNRPSPGYWRGPKKEPSRSKRLPVRTKNCPSCGKKMQSSGSGKGWQCRFCGYERSI